MFRLFGSSSIDDTFSLLSDFYKRREVISLIRDSDLKYNVFVVFDESNCMWIIRREDVDCFALL